MNGAEQDDKDEDKKPTPPGSPETAPVEDPQPPHKDETRLDQR